MHSDDHPFVDDEGALHLPRQVIPPPKSISQQAQAFLSSPRVELSSVRRPIRDRETWDRYITEVEVAMAPYIQAMEQGTSDACTVEEIEVGDARVYVATPHEVPSERSTWARVTVHGGAFVLLGGRYSAAEAAQTAVQSRCVVFGIDYRQPPDYPYPTPLDDVIETYRHVLKSYAPGKIALSGTSSGGNLAAAAVLKARDAGLPLPGALVLSTPLCDLTRSGDRWATNRHLDNMLGGDLSDTVGAYLGGTDPKDPLVSPIFGDFTKGYPPTLLMSGTRDRLLSDTVLLHRALRN